MNYFSSKFLILFKQNFKNYFKDSQRLATPFLLGIILTLIFSFGIDLQSLDPADRSSVSASLLVTTMLFTLYALLEQTLDEESFDDAYTQIRLAPKSNLVWYLAKLCSVGLISFVLLAMCVSSWCLFQQLDISLVFSAAGFGLILLTVCSCAALGICVCAITQSSRAKTLIYPLLFFPLSSPVIIAFSIVWRAHLDQIWGINNQTDIQPWYLLICSFCGIYTSLGYAAFNEVSSLGFAEGDRSN